MTGKRIDEISKDILKNYVKKAEQEKEHHNVEAVKKWNASHELKAKETEKRQNLNKEIDSHTKSYLKRSKGIEMAKQRMAESTISHFYNSDFKSFKTELEQDILRSVGEKIDARRKEIAGGVFAEQSVIEDEGDKRGGEYLMDISFPDGQAGTELKNFRVTGVSEKGALKNIENMFGKGKTVVKNVRYYDFGDPINDAGAGKTGKAVKEEVEKINEISKDTLKSYVDKKSKVVQKNIIDKKYKKFSDVQKANTPVTNAIQRLKKGDYDSSEKEKERYSNSENLVKDIKTADDDRREVLIKNHGHNLKGEDVYGLIRHLGKKRFGNPEHHFGDDRYMKTSSLGKLYSKKLKEEVEYLNESARLLKTYSNGNKTAKVYKDNVWQEHRVKYFTDGNHHKDADSFHDHDKDGALDAHTSAQHYVNRTGVYAEKQPKK